MPGSERLFNQAEGRTKWYVCKLKPDTGMWAALLNVRVRDSWNRPRKVGVAICLQIKPTSFLGKHTWTKRSVLELMQGGELPNCVLASCSHSRVSGRAAGSFHLRKTLGSLVQLGRGLRELFRQALGLPAPAAVSVVLCCWKHLEGGRILQPSSAWFSLFCVSLLMMLLNVSVLRVARAPET